MSYSPLAPPVVVRLLSVVRGVLVLCLAPRLRSDVEGGRPSRQGSGREDRRQRQSWSVKYEAADKRGERLNALTASPPTAHRRNTDKKNAGSEVVPNHSSDAASRV